MAVRGRRLGAGRMTPGTLAVVSSLGIVPLLNQLEPYGDADRRLACGDIVFVVYRTMPDLSLPVMLLVVESGRVSWAYAEDFSEEKRYEP